MVDNPDSYSWGAGGAVLGGGALWLAQMLWNRVLSTEGKGHLALVQQLSDRIASQEARLQSLEAGLDSERDARRLAEDKVHALQLDNMTLRAILAKHGIDVPPPSFAAEATA